MGRAARERAQEQGLLPDEYLHFTLTQDLHFTGITQPKRMCNAMFLLFHTSSKLDLAVFAKRVVSRVPFPYTLVIKTEAETITVPVWFSTKIKFIQHYLFKVLSFFLQHNMLLTYT